MLPWRLYAKMSSSEMVLKRKWSSGSLAMGKKSAARSQSKVSENGIDLVPPTITGMAPYLSASWTRIWKWWLEWDMYGSMMSTNVDFLSKWLLSPSFLHNRNSSSSRPYCLRDPSMFGQSWSIRVLSSVSLSWLSSLSSMFLSCLNNLIAFWSGLLPTHFPSNVTRYFLRNGNRSTVKFHMLPRRSFVGSWNGATMSKPDLEAIVWK